MRRRAMFWVGIAAGGLVGLVLLAALAGSMVERHHVASVRVRIAAPPPEVWATVRDFGAWKEWNPAVKGMERLPDRDGKERWRLSDATGGFPSLVEVSTPPSAGNPGVLRTRIDDPDLPFGGTWTWEVAPDGAGAAVTITEDGEIRNPIFRLLARFVFGYHGTAEKFLGALARRHGAEAATERVR
jgi:hypothetical protein